MTIALAEVVRERPRLVPLAKARKGRPEIHKAGCAQRGRRAPSSCCGIAVVGAEARNGYLRRRFFRRSFLLSARRVAVVELFNLGITPEAMAFENCVPILRRCMRD